MFDMKRREFITLLGGAAPEIGGPGMTNAEYRARLRDRPLRFFIY